MTSLGHKLRNEVIPAARKQMMKLSDSWEGTGSQAALDEASAIIDKHEANATAADDTAGRLRNMEASVVKTKNAVNKNAEDVQRDCEKLNNTNLRGEVRATRIADRIASGVAENIAVVSGNTMELSGNLGVPLGTPGADGKMPRPRRRKSRSHRARRTGVSYANGSAEHPLQACQPAAPRR